MKTYSIKQKVLTKQNLLTIEKCTWQKKTIHRNLHANTIKIIVAKIIFDVSIILCY